jgi:hypothetical protein
MSIGMTDSNRISPMHSPECGCQKRQGKLTFRQTLPSDVEELFSVRARNRENPISKEQLAEFGITPESIARHPEDSRIRGWVCSHESGLVGFCNGDRETGEILVLAVLPEYTGTWLLPIARLAAEWRN